MATPRKGENKENEGESLRTLLLPPTLPCLTTFGVFSARGSAKILAVSHTVRHPENWL